MTLSHCQPRTSDVFMEKGIVFVIGGKIVGNKKTSCSKNSPLKRRIAFMKSRAVKDDDKKIKKELLVRAAISLFNKSSFEKISMDQIAKKAGVAKGTLYLYFKTKEELFLEIHRLDYDAWFEAFQNFLRSKKPGLSSAELASWITNSLKENQRTVRLMAIASALLEKNVVFDSALRFKDSVRKSVLESAPELCRALKLKTSDEAVLFLTYLHALIIGLWHHAEPAPIVVKVLNSSPDFAVFRIDFFQTLELGIISILSGIQKNS